MKKQYSNNARNKLKQLSKQSLFIYIYNFRIDFVGIYVIMFVAVLVSLLKVRKCRKDVWNDNPH